MISLRKFAKFLLTPQRYPGSTERVDTLVLQVIYRFKDPNVPFGVGQQMEVFIATVQQNGP